MPARPDILFWLFASTVLAVLVLAAGLGIAMIGSQRRLRRTHEAHMRQLHAAHEEERKKVASDLHDDVVQRLVLLGQELDIASSTPESTPENRHDLRAIRAQLESLAEDLRQIARGLHPVIIAQAGLTGALGELAEQLERTGVLTVEVIVPSTGVNLSVEQALALYRITQEALSNVSRHAGTNEASVVLKSGAACVELEIADRGVGFERAGETPGPGLGLLNIEERAKLVGGTAAIESRPGKGTTVRVSIPRLKGG